MNDNVFFDMPYTALGDQLCFLSAARVFARIFRDCRVNVGRVLPKVVAAYDDDLIHSDFGGAVRRVEPGPWHRMHDHRGNANYVGTYLREMGVQTPALRPELPDVEPMPGLTPGGYVAIQPRSVYAKNPGGELVTRIRTAIPESVPMILVGAPDTVPGLSWCDYGYLGDPLTMLRVIRHARFVLTPRSASAHVAAAYRVPSVVWVPDDVENWHINYPDWPHDLIEFERHSWAWMRQLSCAQKWLETVLS